MSQLTITLIILTTLLLPSSNGFSQTNESNKINHSDNMEWEQVDELLKRHITNKVSVQTGLNDIRPLLVESGNEAIIESFNTDRMSEELKNFLTKTLTNNPVPKEIKAISLGIFDMLDNDIPKTTIYLCGSDITPDEDEFDWNVDPVYFPKYYFISKDFEIINSKYSNLTGDQELPIFNGILNLLVINELDDFQKSLLGNRTKLFVGAGFDSGFTLI